jgi:hypothetical protein
LKNYSNYHIQSKDKIINDAYLIFQKQLDGFEGFDVEIDGVLDKVIIRQHTNPLNEDKEDRQLECWKDTAIKRGSLVELVDYNEKWLVVTDVDSNGLTKLSKILKCNNTFKWQTPTGEIKEYPCIIQDKTSVYSSGIEENKYLSLADDQILIIVQSNDDTKQLQINKRFIFNHSKYEVYELTKIQTLIQNGLLYLTMTKSQYNETSDNLDDNIADYMPTNFTLTILNGDTISLNTSQTLQLSCELRNNGVLVENPTITYQSSDPLIASINSSGVITALQTGIVTITARSSGVSDSLIVTVEEVPVNNYSIEFVNPPTSIYQGQSKTYNVKTLNNGVEITDKAVVFTVSDLTLASITSQSGLSCVVKGSSNKIGNVVLRCEFSDDNTVYKDVVIQVKSIV